MMQKATPPVSLFREPSLPPRETRATRRERATREARERLRFGDEASFEKQMQVTVSASVAEHLGEHLFPCLGDDHRSTADVRMKGRFRKSDSVRINRGRQVCLRPQQP